MHMPFRMDSSTCVVHRHLPVPRTIGTFSGFRDITPFHRTYTRFWRRLRVHHATGAARASTSYCGGCYRTLRCSTTCHILMPGGTTGFLPRRCRHLDDHAPVSPSTCYKGAHRAGQTALLQRALPAVLEDKQITGLRIHTCRKFAVLKTPPPRAVYAFTLRGPLQTPLPICLLEQHDATTAHTNAWVLAALLPTPGTYHLQNTRAAGC